MSRPATPLVYRLALRAALLLALALALPARAAPQPQPGLDLRGPAYSDLGPALAGDLERALERSIAEIGAPGASLYVYVPGRGAWVGARGLADVERGLPLVPHDRLRLASVTKSFVAVLALQLVQEGWLSLDQSVEHWLPGLVRGAIGSRCASCLATPAVCPSI